MNGIFLLEESFLAKALLLTKTRIICWCVTLKIAHLPLVYIQARLHSYKMADRVKQLNEISDVLEKSSQNLDSLLKKIGWNKRHLVKNNRNYAKCPIDSNHFMPSTSIDRHSVKCKMERDNIKPQDLCPSSDFFYNHSPGVVSVKIDKKEYNSFKQLDNPGGEQSGTKQDTIPPLEKASWSNPGISDVITGDMLSTGTKSMKSDNQSTSTVTPWQPSANEKGLQEIRAISRWVEVPPGYHHLDIRVLDENAIKSWIHENLPRTQYLSSVPDGNTSLVNFILSCLKEPRVASPGGMRDQLLDLMGEESTDDFLLDLWKFLAISITCNKHAITEGQRISAENVPEDTEELNIEKAPLPMSRVDFDLTVSQRLAMYDYVIQTAKTRKRNARDDLSGLVASDDPDAASNQDLLFPLSIELTC
ncbi:uncharacterized protein LOC116612335 isoform X2 [Nematostella vectensis]|uniref:uncharacterized protein LOC116612335 isoform X2 n=1 Tax=Nematostella vectensis TaxID=45351 RepID=UPI002077772F|nr:uncharacterized protein LOC116612335 isoform X2 [Nematostella vectensis]XP_048590681.1 uncharacterized protein LOC116612335 isoform X2 [Nematostella vectensis]